MADTTVSNSRALTYRDPTISAAAALQLRRNRQQSLDALADQAQQTADAAARVSKVFQNQAEGYRAAQDAADQAAGEQTAGGNTAAIEQQTEQSTQATASQTGTQPDDTAQEQATGQQTAATGQPTVAFTAQQIAQEQLGLGLHLPPLQPADEAYRRAGAEPPLQSEESPSTLFAVAV